MRIYSDVYFSLGACSYPQWDGSLYLPASSCLYNCTNGLALHTFTILFRVRTQARLSNSYDVMISVPGGFIFIEIAHEFRYTTVVNCTKDITKVSLI